MNPMLCKTLLPLSLFVASLPLQLNAQLYWDTNGALTGAGTAGIADGIWDTGTTANWSTDSTGQSAPTTFTADDTVIFSAGSDVTSANITLSGTQAVNNITFEEGNVTLNGEIDDASGNILITVMNGATGFINNTGSAAFNADFDVQGSGSLTVNVARAGGAMNKTGTGTLTAHRLDATLTVSEGLLIHTGTAGAKLKNTTINGGTLRLTGKSFDGTSRSVTIASGGILEIGAGVTGDTVTLASSAGDITGGAGSALSLNSGTFTGDITGDISITKVNTGTLTYGSGANITSTGNITVNTGTFTMADGSAITFTIGADGVNNAILGAGTDLATNLNGTFAFDLSGAEAVGGNSWLIVDVDNLAESFGSTFAVADFEETAEDSGIWILGDYTFTESSGLLTYGAVIPEPSSFALLGGLGALLAAATRRRGRAARD